MRIGPFLMRIARRGGFVLLLPAIFASLSDALVLAGLRVFLGLVGDSTLPSWIPFSHETIPLSYWVGAMLFLVSIRLIALVWKQQILERITRYLDAFLQIWLHRITKRLPPAFFHDVEGQDSLHSAYDGSRTIVLSAEALAQALQAVLQLLVFLPLLFLLSWPLTLALLLGMLPLLAWLQGYLRRLGKGMGERMLESGRLDALQANSFATILHWSLPRERTLLAQQVSRVVRLLRDQGLKLGQRKSLLVLVSDSLAAVAVVAVLAFCGWWMRQGGMSGTDLILYAAALILCYKPVKDCLRVVPSIREATLAKDHLQSLEQLALLRRHAPFLESKNAAIHISDLAFQFQGRNPVRVFQNVHLSIPTQKPLWLKGANGCGKTTLLRILAGLELPDQGSIAWPSSLLHSAKGFLSHKGIVPLVDHFTWSLVDSPSKTELLRVLGISQSQIRDGLSAGQRQKLGIAWLFCSQAKVLLLDEPFSFIAQKDREPVLAAMLACAEAHGIWFAMASHDPFPTEWESRFTVQTLENL